MRMGHMGHGGHMYVGMWMCGHVGGVKYVA
jgi:hypothetical protein